MTVRRVASSVLALVVAGGHLASSPPPVRAAPANDDYRSAQALPGTSGVVTGTNVGATSDACYAHGEWPLEHSVWYLLSVPHTGWVTLDVTGSSFAAQLRVEAADGLCPAGRGIPIDSARPYSFETPAARYWVGVGGPETGSVVLSYRFERPPAPPNDHFRDALEVFGRRGVTELANFHATAESGEPVHRGQPGGRSVWFRWRAPHSGRAAFWAHPQDAVVPTVAVYTGDTLGSVTALAPGSDPRAASTARFVFTATAGVVYRIAVDTSSGRETTVGTPYDRYRAGMSLAWNSGPPPANDDFAAATLLAPADGYVVGDQTGARPQAGEPDHSDRPGAPPARGGASVWYRWSAPTSGPVTFHLHAPWPVQMSAYEGSDLSGLRVLADSTSMGFDRAGLVFDTVAGRTYHVAVDALFERTGTFRLMWFLPIRNDAFADATTISGRVGSFRGSADGATHEAGEPRHAGLEGHASVWYRWTAPMSGNVVFDTLGHDFHERLGVYTGDRVDGLAPVAPTESLGEAQRVTFSAVQGREYRIALDFARSGGGFQLNWRLGPADATPPTIRLLQPDGAVMRDVAIAEAEANDDLGVARVTFLRDGELWAIDEHAPYTVSWTEEGSVSLQARVADVWGNVTTTSVRTIRVDAGPPQQSWGASTPEDGTAATFSMSAGQGSTYECSLDAAAFAPCTFPVTYGGLPGGWHWFRARATDTDGNTVSSPAAELWKVPGRDVTAPTGSVRIDGGAAYARSTSVTLQLQATDDVGAVTSTRVSNSASGPWAEMPYRSPVTWSLSDAAYGGSTANGTRTVYVRWRDDAGNWSSPASDTITLDTAAPSRPGTPRPELVAGTQLGTSGATVRVRWPAVTDATSGVRAYRIEQSDDRGGTWRLAATTAATSLTRVLATNSASVFRFRVAAIDRAGNTGAYAYSASFRMLAYDQTAASVTYRGTWYAESLGSSAYGGSVRYARRSTDRASLRFDGQSVALVAPKGPTRGKATLTGLWGSSSTVVDEYRSAFQGRSVVMARNGLTAGAHTLTIAVQATSGRPRFDIDGFLVLRVVP